MFHKRIEKLLILVIGTIVGTLVGWYVLVLLCDIWQLQRCVICR